MKRLFLFLFMTMYLIMNLLAQKQDDNLNSPKENSHVTREYDEKGNLIKFDSVYSYSWSSDTTLLKSLSPSDFPDIFGDHFGLNQDSTLTGNSFFDGFDSFFSDPFDHMTDSLLMKKFGFNHQFHSYNFDKDSTSVDFNFFDNYNKGEKDSISNIAPGHSFQPKSMDELMKMLQQQMEEMEEYHKKFLLKNSKPKEL